MLSVMTDETQTPGRSWTSRRHSNHLATASPLCQQPFSHLSLPVIFLSPHFPPFLFPAVPLSSTIPLLPIFPLFSSLPVSFLPPHSPLSSALSVPFLSSTIPLHPTSSSPFLRPLTHRLPWSSSPPVRRNVANKHSGLTGGTESTRTSCLRGH